MSKDIPFSIRHNDVLGAMRPHLDTGARSFLHAMTVKAERSPSFALDMESWITGHETTVFLRDTIMPQMRPNGDAVVRSPARYCDCCKLSHGGSTKRAWSAFHDTPWEALDSAAMHALEGLCGVSL